MKKVIMMLAFVGSMMSTDAQEVTDEYRQKGIQASNTVFRKIQVDNPHLAKVGAKKTNGTDMAYPYVKEVLRNRYGKIGDNDGLENFIKSNPTAVNYVKTSESFLYSLGLSKKEVKYLKEYMSSAKK